MRPRVRACVCRISSGFISKGMCVGERDVCVGVCVCVCVCVCVRERERETFGAWVHGRVCGSARLSQQERERGSHSRNNRNRGERERERGEEGEGEGDMPDRTSTGSLIF